MQHSGREPHFRQDFKDWALHSEQTLGLELTLSEDKDIRES